MFPQQCFLVWGRLKIKNLDIFGFAGVLLRCIAPSTIMHCAASRNAYIAVVTNTMKNDYQPQYRSQIFRSFRPVLYSRFCFRFRSNPAAAYCAYQNSVTRSSGVQVTLAHPYRRGLAEDMRELQQGRERDQKIGITSKNKSSARPARAVYICKHFYFVLALTTTWIDQIWDYGEREHLTINFRFSL